MNLVREHIYEKFVEDSDPIRDLNIGKIRMIKDWIEYYDPYSFAHSTYNFHPWKYKINNDLTIDMFGNIDLNSAGLYKLPDYIKFNKIEGDFLINWNNFENMKNFPREITGNFYVNGNPLISLKGCPEKVKGFYISSVCGFTEKDIKKVCEFNQIELITRNRKDEVFREKPDYYKNYRKEKLHEKFEQDSDPIHDMGIGEADKASVINLMKSLQKEYGGELKFRTYYKPDKIFISKLALSENFNVKYIKLYYYYNPDEKYKFWATHEDRYTTGSGYVSNDIEEIEKFLREMIEMFK